MGVSQPRLASTNGDLHLTPLLPHLPPPTVGPTPCEACPLQSERLALRQQVGYWKAMHQRACQREAALRQHVAELEAQLRLLRQQHFGRSSEARQHADQLLAAPAAATTPDADGPPPAIDTQPGPAPAPGHRRRPRGQQRGRPGHGRRDHSHLPTIEEEVALPADQQCCAACGQPFADFPGTDDTTVLEVAVQAHRRLIRRRRYRPTCTCGVHPGIVTPPPPPRLIPKSPFGISLWVLVLLDKYQFYRPTYRLLQDLRSHGLDLSPGGLTEGLKRLVPLFEPLYEALLAHNQRQHLWNADETRWLVFASTEGKVGYQWYLWLFQSTEAVVFVLAAGRSHDVPEEHFAPGAGGILVVDRFSAYKAMDQVKAGKIILAFCWAHQRRDFVELARSWPEQQSWAGAWLERIGELYALQQRRLELREDSEGFEQRDRDLRTAVDQMAQQAETELASAELHPACRRVLESLGAHWTGLTVFVEHPEVPMDNNQAERTERGPVVARKNFYGSGALWAGHLAAWMFSLVATLRQWEINPRAWLTAYLTACAESGGKAPAEVSRWLPWNLTAAQRAAWRVPEARKGRDTS
jgi:transposase